MEKKFIEDFLFSDLVDVKGGQGMNDCHCSSGAGEVVIITEDPGGVEHPIGPRDAYSI